MRSRPHAAASAKGRLIRCTALGSTPNRLAIPRSFALVLGLPKASADSSCDHRPLKLGKHPHHLKHGFASRWCSLCSFIAGSRVLNVRHRRAAPIVCGDDSRWCGSRLVFHFTRCPTRPNIKGWRLVGCQFRLPFAFEGASDGCHCKRKL
jgi:hypothetical protein